MDKKDAIIAALMGGMAPAALRGGMGALGDSIVGVSSEGRPAYGNPDGSMSTERSATVLDPRINQGMATNIPTIFEGRQMSEDEAGDYILEHGRVMAAKPESGMVVDPVTGRRLEGHPSIEIAEDAARKRSEMIKVLVDPVYSKWAR